MNKPTKPPTVQDALDELDAGRNVHVRLSMARERFHALQLKKSGKNTFAGYSYFELGDFLIPALKVFRECGLGAIVTFEPDLAIMNIVNLDNPQDRILLTSPMGSAALKGCHEVQNIGAVETYQRRYLWVAALEIVEHDALDKTAGKQGFSTGETPPKKRVPLDGPYTCPTQLMTAARAFVRTLESCGDMGELIGFLETKDSKEFCEQLERDMPGWWSGGEGLPAEFVPLEIRIANKKRELEELETLQGVK